MVKLSVRDFQQRPHPGFTLLETVISFGIFSMALLAVVAVFMTSVRANRQASAAQAMIDNVRFALEFMEREMRTGLEFVDENGNGTVLKFTNDRVKTVCYRSALGVVERFEFAIYTPSSPCPLIGYQPLTTLSIVNVANLVFSIAGQNPLDTQQPRITFTVQATPSLDTTLTFNAESTISQRTLDIP